MILLTGFEGYGGRSINPAEAVTKALDGTVVAGVPVIGRTLAVDYGVLRRALPDLIEAEKPDIVVSLGLWPGEPMIRLERVAINYADFEIADNVGNLLHQPIAPDGAAAYGSPLPLHRMRDAVSAVGIPCRLSGSAGTFLCNATLYTTLEHCARFRPDTLCGFVHLPYLPEQVAGLVDDLAAAGELELHQRADLASMSLEVMIEALRAALTVAVEGSAA